MWVFQIRKSELYTRPAAVVCVTLRRFNLAKLLGSASLLRPSEQSVNINKSAWGYAKEKEALAPINQTLDHLFVKMCNILMRAYSAGVKQKKEVRAPGVSQVPYLLIMTR